MAKISQVAAKYIVHTSIKIDGIVDRPDVIGAVFGQTEGLLGSDLELRELQRSGKIGRIEVKLNTTAGKTKGEIIIPSSLDKTETAIIGAALEIIQRIGPCNATLRVESIEDIRVSKRQFVIKRAKELLHNLTENTLPDSQEISKEVSQSVRMKEIKKYGKDKLPCGPDVETGEDVIIVEGRADVLTLLKHGFKNAISMEGSSVPKTLIELSKQKSMTVFVDGDRGGKLNIRELVTVCEVDFVCRAPEGKEVEELTKKEIHKALRGKITAQQAKTDLGITKDGGLINKDVTLKQKVIRKDDRRPARNDKRPTRNDRDNKRTNDRRPARTDRNTSSRTEAPAPRSSPKALAEGEKKKFKETLEDLFGTRGACIFDTKLSILGKVPLTELNSTIKSLGGGIHAIVLDGGVDAELARTAEKLKIHYLVGGEDISDGKARIKILTEKDLS